MNGITGGFTLDLLFEDIMFSIVIIIFFLYSFGPLVEPILLKLSIGVRCVT